MSSEGVALHGAALDSFITNSLAEFKLAENQKPYENDPEETDPTSIGSQGGVGKSKGVEKDVVNGKEVEGGAFTWDFDAPQFYDFSRVDDENLDRAENEKFFERYSMRNMNEKNYMDKMAEKMNEDTVVAYEDDQDCDVENMLALPNLRVEAFSDGKSRSKSLGPIKGNEDSRKSMSRFQTPARSRITQDGMRASRASNTIHKNDRTVATNSTLRSKSVGPKSRSTGAQSSNLQKELTIPKPFSFASDVRSRRKSEANVSNRNSENSSRKSIGPSKVNSYTKTPSKEFKTPMRSHSKPAPITTQKSITKPKEFTFASASRSRKSLSSQDPTQKTATAPRTVNKSLHKDRNSKIGGTTGLPRVLQKKELSNAPKFDFTLPSLSELTASKKMHPGKVPITPIMPPAHSKPSFMRPKSTIKSKQDDIRVPVSQAPVRKSTVTVPRPFEFRSSARMSQQKDDKLPNSNLIFSEPKKAAQSGLTQRNVTIPRPFNLQSALKPAKTTSTTLNSTNSWKEKLKQQTENGPSATRPVNLRLHTEERAQKRKAFDHEKNMRFEAAAELRKNIQQQKDLEKRSFR